MIRISEINFTRYTPVSYVDKKPRWDVLLKSGPQFVISEKDFVEINDILRYESEEVDRLIVYGRPSWVDHPGVDWAHSLPDKAKDELIDRLAKMNFPPIVTESKPKPDVPAIPSRIAFDVEAKLDDKIEDDEMEVKGFDMVKTEQSIADMFSSMVEKIAEDVKTGASLDTYSKPKSYPQRRY